MWSFAVVEIVTFVMFGLSARLVTRSALPLQKHICATWRIPLVLSMMPISSHPRRFITDVLSPHISQKKISENLMVDFDDGYLCRIDAMKRFKC